MKKVITAVSAILIVGFFAASSYAWGCGGMYGRGMNGNGHNQTGNNNGAYQSFINDTQDLRDSLSADRTELNALMANANPDPKRARALSEQISKSENGLRTKARQNNVSGIGRMGYGQGWSCGITDHNHNFAGCW